LKFEIELHILYYAMSCHKKKKKNNNNNNNKKKIFPVIVIHIIGRNKVYFGGFHIGKLKFYIITMMPCTC